MTIGRTVVGVDTAKRVFQLHWIDLETGEIVDLKLTRARFLDHFANRVPCLVAMEACGGSQHWARRLQELGHEVRLLPAKMVRPFVGGNKNDAHDARAIWTAAQQPGVNAVVSTAAGICTGAAAQKCTTGSVVACPRSPWEARARGDAPSARLAAARAWEGPVGPRGQAGVILTVAGGGTDFA